MYMNKENDCTINSCTHNNYGHLYLHISNTLYSKSFPIPWAFDFIRFVLLLNPFVTSSAHNIIIICKMNSIVFDFSIENKSTWNHFHFFVIFVFLIHVCFGSKCDSKFLVFLQALNTNEVDVLNWMLALEFNTDCWIKLAWKGMKICYVEE